MQTNNLREALGCILCTAWEVDTANLDADEAVQKIASIAETTLNDNPPRNCDRPECATTKAAQDVWRKEDGGKTAYYEWLLAPHNEGGKSGNE